MAWKDCRVPVELGEVLQAAEHLVDIAAGKVGPSTTVEEQRVTGDQATVEQKALAARCVSGCVQQLDVDRADTDLVAVGVSGEVACRDPGDARNPLHLMFVHVNGYGNAFEQICQTWQGEAHHLAADMVGMVVCDQDAGDPHPVGFGSIDEIGCRVGGIDDKAVACLAVADQVREVTHLRRDRITNGPITAGQQLAKVQTVCGHTSIVSAAVRRGGTGPATIHRLCQRGPLQSARPRVNLSIVMSNESGAAGFAGKHLDAVAAKLRLPIRTPDFIDRLITGTAEELGTRTLRQLIVTWDAAGGGPFAATTVGAVSATKAVETLQALFIGPIFEKLLVAIGADDIPLRASLCASQLVGLGMMRYAARTEPIASADVDTLVAAIAPTLQRYLVGEIA